MSANLSSSSPGSGRLFVVCAPSGAGKSTLTRLLIAADPAISLSISHTTRPPRPGEQDGREYHFVSLASFEAMQKAGDFLESAHVHGNYYGTSKRWIIEQRAKGRDVLLEIDWQGARQVRKVFSDPVGIFVLPPSVATLRERLLGRGQDSAEVIARRVAAARAEMLHVNEFDYVIINNDLARALDDLKMVVGAARLSCAAQQAAHPALFTDLLAAD